MSSPTSKSAIRRSARLPISSACSRAFRRGKAKGIVRGRSLTEAEEHEEVRAVAGQKSSVLAMSLDAVERQGMPFVGESGGIAAGQGMGTLPELSDRLAEARRAAADHRDHPADPNAPRRAPRPEKMER